MNCAKIFPFSLLYSLICFSLFGFLSIAAFGQGQSSLTSLRSFEDFRQLSKEVKTPTGSHNVVKILYARGTQGRPGQIHFINTSKYFYHQDFANEVLKAGQSLEVFNKNYEGTGKGREFNLGTLIFIPEASSGTPGNPTGKVLLELWSGDSLALEYLKEFFQRIQASLSWNIPLLYHPLGAVQEEMMKASREEIPYITSDELYKNRPYLVHNEGVSYGYLKFVDGGEAEEEICLDQTHIAVYKKAPNDIGFVGGIITEEFQTPLSHINIKSMNRGTVNLSLKDAFAKLASYKDLPVKLEALGSGYKITVLSKDQADAMIAAFWDKLKPKNSLRPLSRLGTSYGKDFIPLKSLFSWPLQRRDHQNMIQIMGAKSTNLAVLNTLMGARQAGQWGVYVPQGFGTPFDFYEEFLNTPQANLDETRPERITTPKEMILEKMQKASLLDEGVFHGICQARTTLSSIREMIGRAKVSKNLLGKFKKALIDDADSPIHQTKVGKIRLRSSTNAEDLEGFNGAGLYNSTGLALYEESGEEGEEVMDKNRPLPWEKLERKLMKKIPFIFSSVWNDRAFEEREWFSLRGKGHLNVKVGMALHRAFPAVDINGDVGEGGNGVALTKNIYQAGNGAGNDEGAEFAKILINGQHGDVSVTNPPGAEELEKLGQNPDEAYMTEQILVAPYHADPEKNHDPESWREWTYEILSKSSLKGGEPVLKNEGADEIRRLSKALNYLGDQFARLYQKSPDSFVLDTEWKVYGPDRKIWIKQARPLTLPSK